MADELQNVSYSAGWTQNIPHRRDPNRVNTLQTPVAGPLERRPPAAATLPASPSAEHVRPAPGVSPRHDPQARPAEPSYYDVPMLQRPLWKWEIATYFYLGGLSAGAYLLGRVADRVGGRQYRDVAKIGAYVAMAALLPSPPLLIHDLGDPKRFHHMLRVWKPTSPMNFGTWAIVAYSGMAAFEVVRQYLTNNASRISPAQRQKLLKLMNNGTLLLIHDAAGVPFSLIVAGYTGVLLSCTSNPLWCKNPWLGPLFSASALSTGSEAISLVMDLTHRQSPDRETAQRSLQNVDSAAHLAELACMSGFMKFAGEKAWPLHRGKSKKNHWFSIGGIIGCELLKRLEFPRPLRRPMRVLSALLGLGAGLSLRWGMIFGAHEAAADPHLSRVVSRPQDSAKRSGGKFPAAGMKSSALSHNR